MIKGVFLIFIFLFSISAKAEYRVFLLQVKDAEGNELKSFPSTLDPLQYRLYHPLAAGRKLEYQQTWMCKGNTNDFKPLCENPNPPAENPDASKANPSASSGDAARAPAQAPLPAQTQPGATSSK